MSTLARRPGFTVVTAFVVAVAVFVAALVLGGHFAASADADSPLLEAPTTTTALGTFVDPLEMRADVLTRVPPLPQPEAPPDDPYADVPIVPVGSVVIPKIGLDHTVYEGIWLTVIDEGPGHWPGSAMPGERGNTVFPGHRVTNSRPFY
ncbi:MAG TPA: sortase, partial [Acidimicrobiia bacterium]|nr:sortase [Acidimicrobiia bacterium]